VSLEDDLQRLELVVARVREVTPHAGARGPSVRLVLDCGPRGEREALLVEPPADAADLVGRQLVCALGVDDALVLTAHSHARGLVLVGPDREVEDGTTIG
jgi:hypothetical protein